MPDEPKPKQSNLTVDEANKAADLVKKVIDLLKSLDTKRAVVLEVQNLTTNTLRRRSEHHDDGGFVEIPKLEIPPGTADVFGSRDDSPIAGTKGEVIYDSVDGFTFTIKWENPILGDPTCDAAITPGRFRERHTSGKGETAHMQYVVEPGLTLAPILRKSSPFVGPIASAGKVSEIAVIRSGPTGILTAVKTDEGTLKLIPWAVANDGSISRIIGGDADGGKASSIDIARGSQFVTAYSDGSDNLKLVGWEVDQNGAVHKTGAEADAGEVKIVKIIALTNDLFVTAVKNGANNLMLIAWQLNGNSLERRGDSRKSNGGVDQAHEVDEISLVQIADAQGNHRVVTSVRDGSKNLNVIVWSISPDGGAISRKSFRDDLGGEASMIRSIVSPSGHLVTSMRNGSGNLFLRTFDIAEDGNISRAGDTHDAGEISDDIFDFGFFGDDKDRNALMSRPNGVLSAVNGGSGLKLIGWDVAASGAIERVSESGEQAGEAPIVALCLEPLLGEGPIVTAVKSASETLKLISWADHQ